MEWGYLITAVFSLGVGMWVGGTWAVAGILRQAKRGRVDIGSHEFTVVRDEPLKKWTPPPAEDPGAARIISIVRGAMAAGQFDAEIAHREAERSRAARKVVSQADEARREMRTHYRPTTAEGEGEPPTPRKK